MKITFVVAILLLIVPACLFFLQYRLCKKQSNFALILPIIVACFFVILGFYALIISGIMYGIYFIMKKLEKDKQDKEDDVKRMTIQDLE